MKKTKMGELREAANLSQKDLAIKAGMNVLTINRIERGDVEPTLTQAKAIAKALGATIEEVFAEAAKKDDEAAPEAKEIVDEFTKKMEKVSACGDFLNRPKAYDEAIAEYNKAHPEAKLRDVTDVVGFFDMVLADIKSGDLVIE